jgi:hypothetical protein
MSDTTGRTGVALPSRVRVGDRPKAATINSLIDAMGDRRVTLGSMPFRQGVRTTAYIRLYNDEGTSTVPATTLTKLILDYPEVNDLGGSVFTDDSTGVITIAEEYATRWFAYAAHVSCKVERHASNQGFVYIYLATDTASPVIVGNGNAGTVTVDAKTYSVSGGGGGTVSLSTHQDVHLTCSGMIYVPHLTDRKLFLVIYSSQGAILMGTASALSENSTSSLMVWSI